MQSIKLYQLISLGKKQVLMSKSVMNKLSTGNQNKQATVASYELSLRIAKKGASHTVGEEIILPAAKIISENLCSEMCSKLISGIHLSNTTVKRRIDEMANMFFFIFFYSVKEALIIALKQVIFLHCSLF